MEIILGGIAFALMLAAQLLAVVAVHGARVEGEAAERPDLREDSRGRHIWLFGS